MSNAPIIINNTYRLIRPIGKGGTGIIYLAEHMNLRKMVVLKKIKSSLVDSITVRQEADILKRLHHTYLPQVYDYIEYDGGVYTVIDHIDGYDLQHYVDSNIMFDEAQLVKWMKQMCDALGYLHSRKRPIYHNDIKPANIIINNSADICLIDFNISSDSSETVNGFTAEYASPEQYYKVLALLGQIQSDRVPGISAASDLYSLGASFYMLASRIKIDVYKVLRGEQPALSSLSTGMSEGFCAIIDKLTDPDPAKRYQSASALKKALENLKKQDAKYRKYLALQSCSLFLSGMLVVGGIWTIYKGIKVMTIKALEEQCSILYSEYDHRYYDKAIDDGIYILSNEEWKDHINDAAAAKINYMIGMSYSKMGEYNDAGRFLNEAIMLQPDRTLRSSYEESQAIILAKQSKFEEASNMLAAAYGDGLSYERYIITIARIDYEKGNYEEIKSIYFWQLERDDVSVSARAEIYELYGDVMVSEADYAEAVNIYTASYNFEQNSNCARKLADAYIRFSNTQSVLNESIRSLEEAASIYEGLNASELRSAEDIINLGKIYRLIGSKKQSLSYYERSLDTLQQAISLYPDDFRAYVQLAYTCNKMGNDADARSYCAAAAERFQADPNNQDQRDIQEFNELKDFYGL